MSGRAPQAGRAREAALFLLLAVSLGAPGCATIANGKRARFQLESRPSGARVLINGAYAGVTPLATELPRKRSHRVEIEFADGQRFGIAFRRRISGWFWANLVLGPVWGGVSMIVDAVVGAMYSLTPREVTTWGRMMLYDGGDRIYVRVYRCRPRGVAPWGQRVVDPDSEVGRCAPAQVSEPPAAPPPPPPPPPEGR